MPLHPQQLTRGGAIMSQRVKLPVTSLLRYGQKLTEEMLQHSRRHKEREYSRCLPDVMSSSLCLLAAILLPQIVYLICMCHIVKS
jgi:hypothetical protein